MKISKKSFARVKKLVIKFAAESGITPMPVERALSCLVNKSLNLLSEYEAAILYDSIVENDEDLVNPEINELKNELETIWAIRAKKNGTKLPDSVKSKTYH